MPRRKADAAPQAEPSYSALPLTDSEPELLPDAVPDEVVERVYLEIRTIARDAAITLNIRVGAVLFEHFYGGSEDAWRDRGQKDASLRKLAAKFDHDDAAPDGTSASALHRAVSIYMMDRRLGVSDRKHLTVSHVRALIGLAEADQQHLLAQAEENKWSIDRVELEASKIRKKDGGGRGRPPLPGFVKGVARMRKLLESGDGLFGDLEMADGLKDAVVESALETVTSMESRLQTLRTTLQARLHRKVG